MLEGPEHMPGILQPGSETESFAGPTLMQTYRHARRLTLIVDDMIIHKTRVTQGWPSCRYPAQVPMSCL